jgi:hypothetical protein
MCRAKRATMPASCSQLPLSPARRRAACAFLLLSLIGVPAFAQSKAATAPADLDQLVRGAQTIVRGRVVSVKIEPHPQFPNLQTMVVTLAVTRTLKGNVPALFTFRQFMLDASDTSLPASYKSTGEFLLFLNPVSQYGLTSPVGLEQGRFRIVPDSQGNRLAVNGRGNSGLFSEVPRKAAVRGLNLSNQARQMMSSAAGPAPLETLESAIQLLSGAPQ